MSNLIIPYRPAPRANRLMQFCAPLTQKLPSSSFVVGRQDRPWLRAGCEPSPYGFSGDQAVRVGLTQYIHQRSGDWAHRGTFKNEAVPGQSIILLIPLWVLMTGNPWYFFWDITMTVGLHCQTFRLTKSNTTARYGVLNMKLEEEEV